VVRRIDIKRLRRRSQVGIKVFVTGGIGGVHRGAEQSMHLINMCMSAIATSATLTFVTVCVCVCVCVCVYNSYGYLGRSDRTRSNTCDGIIQAMSSEQQRSVGGVLLTGSARIDVGCLCRRQVDP
jgi:hypothetical protein